jgi:hypothetical protein
MSGKVSSGVATVADGSTERLRVLSAALYEEQFDGNLNFPLETVND